MLPPATRRQRPARRCAVRTLHSSLWGPALGPTGPLVGEGSHPRWVGSLYRATGGQLEPHARAMVVADAPASGQLVHQLQPETTWSRTRGTRADRAVTVVVDLYPHDVVDGGGPDVHGRTDGLSGVSDAVGDQLGDEQTNVLLELVVRATFEPTRNGPARQERRLGATRHRCFADLREGCRFIWWHCVLPGTPARPSQRGRSGGHSGGWRNRSGASRLLPSQTSGVKTEAPRFDLFTPVRHPPCIAWLGASRAAVCRRPALCCGRGTASGFSIFLRLACGPA